MEIGLLHPGEMGAAIAAALVAGGERVVWASAGRSAETRERAERAELDDVGGVADLGRRCDVVISVCPPHAATDVARQVEGFAGIYLDANAVSPDTARRIGASLPRFVDGGIVGPPPRQAGTTRLYLSGAEARSIAALFEGTAVEAKIVPGEPGAASAVKMAYAAWTKGSAALLLATRALARAEGVEQTLVEEWRMSLPQLDEQSAAASRSALGKGWRWIGEMHEIANTFAASGLPRGFHDAAAEVYRRAAQPSETGQTDLDRGLEAIRDPRPREPRPPHGPGQSAWSVHRVARIGRRGSARTP
jgi:3-hydroxyisobutyrate dehydrogenase-like beta-hydroxyacid dehydrogenase